MFADHGLHTMADQMTGLDQEQMYLRFWKKHDEEGLKQRADAQCAYSLVSHGHNIRRLELSEIGHISFPEEAFVGQKSYIIALKRPKSTKHAWGGKQHEFFVWNKNMGYKDEPIN